MARIGSSSSSSIMNTGGGSGTSHAATSSASGQTGGSSPHSGTPSSGGNAASYYHPSGSSGGGSASYSLAHIGHDTAEKVGGAGGAAATSSAAAFEPPDVFCALGSLIVEGRLPAQQQQQQQQPSAVVGGSGTAATPAATTNAGSAAATSITGPLPRAEARGYSEGPHVELPGRISRHKCCSTEYLCAKNENFRRHMLLLWQNNVSMSIEVLLCSDCRVGRDKAGSLEVTTLPEPGSILLEQWTISILSGRAACGSSPHGSMDALSLLQAVRSYLHFSQLSAWYNRTGGANPRNILIRVTIPGEEFATKFSRAPEQHYFPVATGLGGATGSSIGVSVRSLPRTDEIPLVLCAHTNNTYSPNHDVTQQQRGRSDMGDTTTHSSSSSSSSDEDGKLSVAGSLDWRDPTVGNSNDLRRTLVKAKMAAAAAMAAASCTNTNSGNFSTGASSSDGVYKQQQLHSVDSDSSLPPSSLQPLFGPASSAATTSSSLAECSAAGRLIKSDSMDSMLGDSLLDPPPSLSRMPPKRYQSPSRCGSPSLEAPDHLLLSSASSTGAGSISGRRGSNGGSGGSEHYWQQHDNNRLLLPSYEQSMVMRSAGDSSGCGGGAVAAAGLEEEEMMMGFRLNRHDLMRRRDMNLFLGLHPRLLHGPPRLSLPPKTTSTSGTSSSAGMLPHRPQPVRPRSGLAASTALPCRAMTCQKATQSSQQPHPSQPPTQASSTASTLLSDRLPNHCTRSGKHNCEFEELDEGSGNTTTASSLSARLLDHHSSTTIGNREDGAMSSSSSPIPTPNSNRPSSSSPPVSLSPSSMSPAAATEYYKQTELGAKAKGWSARLGRSATPYSRDSSTDSSQQQAAVAAELRLKTVAKTTSGSRSDSQPFKQHPSMCGDHQCQPDYCTGAGHELSPSELEDVLYMLRSSGSPNLSNNSNSSGADNAWRRRRTSLKDPSVCLEDIIYPLKSRRSSIEEQQQALLSSQSPPPFPPGLGLKAGGIAPSTPQITQVWRAQIASPSPTLTPPLLSKHCTTNQARQSGVDQLDENTEQLGSSCSSDDQQEPDKGALLLEAILKHSTRGKRKEAEEDSPDDPDRSIHSARDTSSYSKHSNINTTQHLPTPPHTPPSNILTSCPQKTMSPGPDQYDENVVELCHDLQSKCSISSHHHHHYHGDKENSDPNNRCLSPRMRSQSETMTSAATASSNSTSSSNCNNSSPFKLNYGEDIPVIEPLDMSFDDYDVDDHRNVSSFHDNSRSSSNNSSNSRSGASGWHQQSSKTEKRRNSIDDDSSVVPSANKKAAFRKSFDSATSMVFHSRNGLPLTSSPAPIRRRGRGSNNNGSIKFDFDSGISTPKDIKRALFESGSPEEDDDVYLNRSGDDRLSDTAYSATPDDDGSGVCLLPKKKKRSSGDTRHFSHNHQSQQLSRSAPASVTSAVSGRSNLLGNFEESVLNGRLEPVSTVEGFTAEIGASGTFHPRHLTIPVTVFFYTLCENSNIASPYLGHINLGKKGYRVPEKGTIQLTLFNPLGTVVKMFVVMYDLTDMPPNSQTFLRQRTLYMPADQGCGDSHDDSRKWLRYLIHLRMMSSKSGKIYLHTDVRMIIFRKSDMDTASDHQQGKGFELRSFTRGPNNPKFSPRK